MTHLAERLCLNALLTLDVETYLICLEGTTTTRTMMMMMMMMMMEWGITMSAARNI
jgi:hypothetical protein